MKLIVVSGLSGSGKSSVLHVLEDMGFFCIDNLPIGLLANFAAQMLSTPEKFYENAAVGIDARNRSEDIRRFPSILQGLRDAELDCQVIFINADDHILIKRFNETRRKHPLTKGDIALPEAITKERSLLEPIFSQANLFIDSSHSNIHHLRDLVRQRVGRKKQQALSLMFLSFGFKHGIPVDADYVFDIRCLPNPYWDPQLRSLTGKDKQVHAFLERHDMVNNMFDHIKNFFEQWIPSIKASDRSYLTVAIGCTGGQHRSVYLVERLAAHFHDEHDVLARHRELV